MFFYYCWNYILVFNLPLQEFDQIWLPAYFISFLLLLSHFWFLSYFIFLSLFLISFIFLFFLGLATTWCNLPLHPSAIAFLTLLIRAHELALLILIKMLVLLMMITLMMMMMMMLTLRGHFCTHGRCECSSHYSTHYDPIYCSCSSGFNSIIFSSILVSGHDHDIWIWFLL